MPKKTIKKKPHKKKPPSPHSSNNSDTQDTLTKEDLPSTPPLPSDIMPIIEASIIPEEEFQLDKKSYNKEDNIIYQKFLDAESALKISCSKCKKNITNQIKILLDYNLCENISITERFALFCVNCFTNNFINNEQNKDNNKINYRVINKMDEYLLSNDWTVRDELKFIEAISRLGFENWYEISRCIGKGILECRNHYYNFYYKSKSDNMPSESRFYLYKKNNLAISNEKNYLSYYEYIPNNKRTNSSNRSLRQNRNIYDPKENTSEKEENISNKNWHNVLGYNPKRNEFDEEYKDEAELTISEMDFEDDLDKDDNGEYKYFLEDVFI